MLDDTSSSGDLTVNVDKTQKDTKWDYNATNGTVKIGGTTAPAPGAKGWKVTGSDGKVTITTRN